MTNKSADINNENKADHDDSKDKIVKYCTNSNSNEVFENRVDFCDINN